MLEKSNRSFSLPPPLLVWAIVLLVASILVVGQAASAAVDVEGRKCVHDAIENNNFRKAFEQACKMADHDCSYSQCILGLMYEKESVLRKMSPRLLNGIPRLPEEVLQMHSSG